MINRFFTYCFLFLFSCASYLAHSKKEPLLINGAGATFPYILYSTWFHQYTTVNTAVRINYRSIGSGGGIRQLIKGTLDFGASDVPIKKEEIKKDTTPILHIPTTLSAVALTYHLPSLSKPLRLDATTIAKIFDGTITQWNDPKLIQLNPDIQLPHQDIVVVYRADGSGTTAVFTEYLSITNTDWTNKVGKGKSVNWPVGIGGKGNEGVLAFLQKTTGAFAYVGMSYALNRKLPVALVKNSSGEFIKPSIESVKKAGEFSVTQNKNYTESFVNVSGQGAYPISSFTYLLIYQQMKKQKGQAIVDFLNWALTEGQKSSASLYYVPLPNNVIEQAKAVVKQIHLVEDNASS